MDLMGDYPNKDMWLGDAIPELTREDIERQYMEAFKEYEPCEEPDPFEADIDEDELVDDAFDILFGEDPNERVRDKEKDPKD